MLFAAVSSLYLRRHGYFFVACLSCSLADEANRMRAVLFFNPAVSFVYTWRNRRTCSHRRYM